MNRDWGAYWALAALISLSVAVAITLVGVIGMLVTR